ncbi:MAG TPA: hypothetical protein VFZ27_14590 [Terriglobia bacterium]|nr:hypothetical protein [Terriglobia bacterium]
MAAMAEIALQLRDEASAQLKQFGDTGVREFGRASEAATATSERIALLRQQYEALAQDAARLQKLPFLTPEAAEGLRLDKQLMQEVQAEAAQFGASFNASGRQAAEGISHSIDQLRQFRGLLTATVGFAALGFYITEWARIAEWIGKAAQAAAGYDAEMKAIEADARAASEASLTSFGKLDAQTRLRLSMISDDRERNRQTLELELKSNESQLANLRGQLSSLEKLKQAKEELAAVNAQLTEQASAGAPTPESGELLDRQFHLMQEISGLESQLGPKTKDLAAFHKELSEKVAAGADRLTDFRVQLNELNLKADPAAKQIDKLAEAMARLAEQERQFQFQGFVRNLEVGQEFAKQQLSQMNATALARLAGLQGGIKDYQDFQKAAAAEEARSFRESAAHESKYLLQTEEEMKRHVRTVEELQKALATGGSFAGISFRALGQTFDQFNAGLREAGRLANEAVEPVSHLKFEMMQLQDAARMSGLTLENFSHAMGDNIAQAIVYGDDIGKAMEKAAKATAAQIAAQSIIWGLYYTAHGIADVFWNPPRAAADFLAAAEFFAIGGAAAGIGAAIPGGSGSGGGGSAAVVAASSSATAGGGRDHTLAAGSASAQAAAQNQPHTIQVVFNGPVYGRGGMQEVIRQINGEVRWNRAQLFASHAINGKSLV